MTDFERGIIDLIKSSIIGCKISLPSVFDWQTAYSFALRHQIIPLIYCGSINSQITLPEKTATEFELAAYKSIAVSTKQQYEFNSLCDRFEKENIAYLPLKGAVLRSLYPKPELRSMGDIDFLIKTEQYGKIKQIMSELNYSEGAETDHELTWNKKKSVIVELHKRLISSANRDYFSYYGDGWGLAKATDKNRYTMSNEDEYIYLFTHYSKHFRCGGIGIRHLVDFYVYKLAFPDIDYKYVERELKKLGLLKFHTNSMLTLDSWFNGSKGTEVTDFITAKIFANGSFGTHEASVIGNAIKTSKTKETTNAIRIKTVLNLTFPSLKNMRDKFPVLNKLPFLLPIMWVVRWFKTLFCGRDKIRESTHNLKMITDSNLGKYRDELYFVGLDFNYDD